MKKKIVLFIVIIVIILNLTIQNVFALMPSIRERIYNNTSLTISLIVKLIILIIFIILIILCIIYLINLKKEKCERKTIIKLVIVGMIVIFILWVASEYIKIYGMTIENYIIY